MLIHELGKLGGAEEFFNGGDDGTNIYKILRGNDFCVLSSHTFADDAFHTGHADTELILEKFTDGADAAITEVVDVVFNADAAHEGENITDRADNIGDTNGAVIVNGKIGSTEHGEIALFGFNSYGNGVNEAASLLVRNEVKNLGFAVVGNGVEHLFGNGNIFFD